MEHCKLIMETNYLSGFIFTKEVINAMKLKGIDDGHIININRQVFIYNINMFVICIKMINNLVHNKY